MGQAINWLWFQMCGSVEYFLLFVCFFEKKDFYHLSS